MIHVKHDHPGLYRSIVAICLFDILLGLLLILLPSSDFSGTRAPQVVTGETNILFGALLALPGFLMLPGVFLKVPYRFVQRALILDFSVWLALTLASLFVVMEGNLYGLVGLLVCAHFTHHRLTVVSEPPVNPASILKHSNSEAVRNLVRGNR